MAHLQSPRSNTKNRSTGSGWRMFNLVSGLLLLLLGVAAVFVTRTGAQVLVLLFPFAPALFGAWQEDPSVQKIGVVLLLLESAAWLVLGILLANANRHSDPMMFSTLGDTFVRILRVLCAYMGVSAFFLMPRDWLFKDESSED